MHPELQGIPVFYASKLATKALRVYQTFVNMMNQHIRSLMDVSNPFKLNFIKNMQRTDFDTVGACVVMASPGFMQTGVSRHLFERWCDDDRNGVVIAGYTVEGTLAHDLLNNPKEIVCQDSPLTPPPSSCNTSFHPPFSLGTLAHDLLNNPKEIVCQDNRVKPRRCQIEFISFSAHVDYAQVIKSLTSSHLISYQNNATPSNYPLTTFNHTLQHSLYYQNNAFIRTVRPDNIVYHPLTHCHTL